MIIKTVFKIGNGKSIVAATVKGTGETAINQVRKLYPSEPIILKGFVVNDQYCKADLTPSWNKKFN